MSKLTAQWSRLTASPRLERSSQCLSVLGSQAWIFGGELLPRQPVDNQFDVVELESEKDGAAATTLKAPTQPLPCPRVGTATVVIGDALYMFEGRGGLEMMPVEEKGAVWRYVPAEGLWELLTPADPDAPYPSGRSYHAMTSDKVENIYVHAGCPEKGRLSDLWAFNVNTRTWTELPTAPSPARGGASLTFYNKKLYRMNGFDGQKELGGVIDVYDIVTRTWSTLQFIPDGVEGPTPRSVGALLAIEINNEAHLVTLFGEQDPSSLGHAGAGKMLGDVWAFDLKNNKWSLVEPSGDRPAPRGWFSADVVQDAQGKQGIIFHGGLAEDNSRLGDVWRLTFA